MDMNAMMAAAQGGGGGGQQAQAQGPPDDGKMVDLTPLIEKSECYAKNASSAFPMTNLFIGDSRLGCKSDADEQLILHVGFQEFVKVRWCCAVRCRHSGRRAYEPGRLCPVEIGPA
jgi:hypothetical protein